LATPISTASSGLAISAAHARARWAAASMALSQKAEAPSAQEIDQLAALRRAYEELTEAYEGLRRMVERGYLPYRPKA